MQWKPSQAAASQGTPHSQLQPQLQLNRAVIAVRKARVEMVEKIGVPTEPFQNAEIVKGYAVCILFKIKVLHPQKC